MTGRRSIQCNHAERGATRPSASPEFGNSAVNAATSLVFCTHQAPTSGHPDCIVFCTSPAFKCDFDIFFENACVQLLRTAHISASPNFLA